MCSLTCKEMTIVRFQVASDATECLKLYDLERIRVFVGAEGLTW